METLLAGAQPSIFPNQAASGRLVAGSDNGQSD
jgi:hypothetical protein